MKMRPKKKMTRGNYNHPINPHQFHQPLQIPHISNNICHPQHHYHHQPSPYDFETRLREEVLYLHSLWHRGPPSQTPLYLRPYNQTHFKRTWRSSISDKEWPVPSKPTSPSPTNSSWPDFKPVSKPVSRPATDEERFRLLGLKIHLKGLDLCSGFFNVSGDDGNGDDDDDSDDDEDDDCEEYEFLMKVFEENGDLREFYVKNCEGGEFYCLICGALINQLRKPYKNCVALVQHCVTISNTKKKAAHRALGHVICKILGWDVNRLPNLPVGDAAAQSLGNSSEIQF